MREDFLFKMLEIGRDNLPETLGKCLVDKRNVVPVGFNNLITKYKGDGLFQEKMFQDERWNGPVFVLQT